jgi:c-di-GMP-binding flagellar brake protein YcgR
VKNTIPDETEIARVNEQNGGVLNQGEVPYRRRYVRVDVSTTVHYSLEGEEASKVGHTSDLGGGGIRLETVEDLPLGTVLLLRFPIPGGAREIVVRGRIVLSFYDAESKQFFHGIAFTHIDPRDQEEIIRYVASEIQRLARMGEGAE